MFETIQKIVNNLVENPFEVSCFPNYPSPEMEKRLSNSVELNCAIFPTRPEFEGFEDGRLYSELPPVMELATEVQCLVRAAVQKQSIERDFRYLTFAYCQDIKKPHFFCYLTSEPFSNSI